MILKAANGGRQDGSILSNDLRLSELRGGRLEVREAEPW